MSKLSQLKQDAYQAGKDRDWERAISVYEQILEIEKKNPSLVNEMGDVCLKAGDSSRAVQHFLTAASLYRKNGLINNAVAIYKKILRHDQGNMNAHWYLAESKAGQGLKVEGRDHVLAFLSGSGKVVGDPKDMFAKRCVTLMDLYHDDEEIVDKLVQLFRMWDMPLETARARVLHCCLKHRRDESDAVGEVEAIVAGESSVVNYPEYMRWNELVNPQAESNSDAFADFGAVDLGESDPGSSDAARPETVPDTVQEPLVGLEWNAQPTADLPRDDASETSFADLNAAGPAGAELELDPLADEKDEEGCISIDTGASCDLDDILAAAVGGVDADQDETAAEGRDSASKETVTADNSVNLLDQILAEDGEDLLGSATEQLETITSEIGAQVGGEADTADRQYEMGLVYLEMGMADQAIESFRLATTDPEYAARAYEMWCMTLERAHREEEAMAVLETGAVSAEVDQAGRLGLLYHLGKLCEQIGRVDNAGDCYDRILAEDSDYMDVASRKAALPLATG